MEAQTTETSDGGGRGAPKINVAFRAAAPTDLTVDCSVGRFHTFPSPSPSIFRQPSVTSPPACCRRNLAYSDTYLYRAPRRIPDG